MPTDFSFARAWRTFGRELSNRRAIVCDSVELTFGEFWEQARCLAWRFDAAGIGADDKVAIDLPNRPEYLVTFFAAQLLGAIPVNVNYRYLGSELAYLLDNSDAAALVFDAQFAGPVAEAVAVADDRLRLLVVVGTSDAGAVAARVPRPVEAWSEALAGAPRDWLPAHEPSGDDLIFIYTGGTTGRPKGVMWRSDDLYVAQWQLARPNTLPRQPEAVVARGSAAASSLPACPLMHGTGLFMALSTLAGAGEVVLIAELGLDPERIWREVARHHVRVLTIVGDVFARPLLDVLDREPTRFDLASLAAITSSGVTWSPTVKRGLLKHLPHVALIDSLGASEGLMSRNESREGDEIAPARFSVGDRLVVISETGGLIVPGSGEIGLLGVGGPIPLGYFKDAEKTAQTFRVVVGHRYSVPGDYARVADDGTIELLGRGSACINTGGEKVYPEEIELVLRAQPGVADCVVVGVPDERWGERVVALVQPSLDGAFDAAACGEACRAALAGYKVPRSILCVTDLERSAAGKPNYARLRDRAAALIATS